MPHSTTSRRYVVYKISNSVNDKLYIGITSRTLQMRWKQHKRDAPTSSFAIHRAIVKYGADAFTIEEIEECPDHPILMERERYWIQHYDSTLPHGYNTTAGGEGIFGMHHSEETKQKIAAKPITPEFRARMSEVAKIRGADPEYRAKISRANSGKVPSEEAKEKIRSARAKQVFTPDAIERRMQKIRGMKHSEQSVANMSKAQKGRYVSPSHRQKISKTLQLLTDEQAAIVKFNAYGLMQKEYAALFGVSAQAINGLVKGRTYTYITREHLPKELQGDGS